MLKKVLKADNKPPIAIGGPASPKTSRGLIIKQFDVQETLLTVLNDA